MLWYAQDNTEILLYCPVEKTEVHFFLKWKKWQLTPVFLSGEAYGQRSPVGYSPWGRKELDTAETT